MPVPVRAIDCWVNANIGGAAGPGGAPESLRRVNADYFKRPDFVHFMNTRGRHKVMYASDQPAIAMDRCLEEAVKPDLRPGVLDDFLYGNAQRVLFENARGDRSAP